MKLEEDIELKLIAQRKLAELRRRLSTQQSIKNEKSDEELVRESLYDRGGEVLDAAYQYYPNETRQIVKEIAKLIRSGRLKEKISGGELYSIFRQLGLNFTLKTSIKVEEKGRLIDLSEKLKVRDE